MRDYITQERRSVKTEKQTDTPTISKGMIDYALKYARRGIPVFPCRSKDIGEHKAKAPLTEHGFKDATCKVKQIRAWWDEWPNAMIGVPTGAASGIDVVDLDVKPEEFIDGRKHLPNWKTLSCTIVTTPSDGAHVYFKSEGSVRNSTDRIAPGIDTRGKGGYIIVPPSYNRTEGGEYRFKKGGMFDTLPAFPTDLLEKLGPRHDGVGGDEPEADPERVSTAMAVIPNADVGWENWKTFGLAIYRATSGTGFEIFDDWSKKSKKYDEKYTRTAWEEIRGSPPDRIGAGTIFYHADLADTKWWRKGDRLVLDLNAPLDSAKEFVRRCYTRNDTGTLRWYRGAFYEWSRDGSHYEECNNDHLRSRLYQFLEQAITIKGKPFNPSAHKVNQIWDALQSGVEVNAKRNPPFLIDEDARSDLGGHIACRNGLLDPITLTLTPHHPDFFNVNSLPFDYDAKAPAYPELWMKFLRELFPGGNGSDGKKARLCLQEMFGLMLTPDTRYQKIFMMIGPRRSGKGTIARILTKLLGKENVANPTLASVASHFGLQVLIDKRCAVIADARLGPQTNVHTVAERLLSISGEDGLTIDRKYKDAWTGQLQVRFLILSNEIPGFTDASGALASRFILLTLQKTFFGKEDLGLADKLMKELPSILNWSLVGLKRLRERGHFLMPELSLDAIRQLEDLASPVGAFLRDWCTTEKAKAKVLVHELYDAYTIWCDVEGHKSPKSNAWFGRDLRAKFPGLKSRGRGHDKFYEGIDLSKEGRKRYEVLGTMRTPDKKVRG